MSAKNKPGLLEAWFDLLGIEKRWAVVDSVVNEMLTRTGQRPFRCRNDALWELLQDSFTCCVIDLSSWKRGFHKIIKRTRTTGVRAWSTPPEARIAKGLVRKEINERDAYTLRKRLEAFGRLFPRALATGNIDANGDLRPSPADYKTLHDRLESMVASVTKSRHNVRAHRHDEIGVASSDSLTLPEFAGALKS